MFWQQQIKINENSETSLEPIKTTLLKRKVGYGQINEKNEEDEARRDKRNKMDVDATGAAGVSSVSGP